MAVVIPTCNRPQDLETLLGSLLAPDTGPPISLPIYVVNNCSNGDLASHTELVAGRYSCRTLRVTIRGKAAAMNEALATLDEDWLVFIDDDVSIHDRDWWRPLAQCAAAHPGVAWISGRVESQPSVRRMSGHLWMTRWGGLDKGETRRVLPPSEASLELRKRALVPRHYCAGANCMVDRRALLAIGGFNTLLASPGPIRHGVTLEPAFRLAASGYGLAYEPGSSLSHPSPDSLWTLASKRYQYAKGDACLPLLAFSASHDPRWLSQLVIEPIRQLRYTVAAARASSGTVAAALGGVLIVELFAMATAPARFVLHAIRVRLSEEESVWR